MQCNCVPRRSVLERAQRETGLLLIPPYAEVLPLVYNALDSDIAPLLDKALRIIPNLAEGLDVSVFCSCLSPLTVADLY